ncbi:MAG: hypothetical protein V7603_2237 [Micromonosporaceae bacterium]
MILRKLSYSLPMALAATVAALLVGVSPASATLKAASCSVNEGGVTYHGAGWTYYHYTGVYDIIDYFEYTQDHGGNQTNVDIAQYDYSWGNGNVIGGRILTHYPTRTIAIPGSVSTATNYGFVFDRNNATDPGCDATTARW